MSETCPAHKAGHENYGGSIKKAEGPSEEGPTKGSHLPLAYRAGLNAARCFR